jgi:hypothetical protein
LFGLWAGIRSLLNPPSAYPPIERPMCGPQGPALRASRVEGTALHACEGQVLIVFTLPCLGNILSPTLRATDGMSCKPPFAPHIPSDTPQDHSSEAILAYLN